MHKVVINEQFVKDYQGNNLLFVKNVYLYHFEGQIDKIITRKRFGIPERGKELQKVIWLNEEMS